MEITNKNCHLSWNLGFISCISIMLRDMLTNLIVDKCRGCRNPLGYSLVSSIWGRMIMVSSIYLFIF